MVGVGWGWARCAGTEGGCAVVAMTQGGGAVVMLHPDRSGLALLVDMFTP